MTDEIMDLIHRNRKRERLPDASKYNESIREGWMPFWARNAARNHSIIEKAFSVSPEPDVAVRIADKGKGKDCIVIGSGPSLDKAMPLLKDWTGDIWVSSSHLTVFEAYNIVPTYCVIIDADPTMTFLVSEAKTENITLVTHPCMEREVLKAWKGPVMYFRMDDPGDPFFKEYLPMMYADLNERGERLRSYVMNSGCVANTCVSLAQYSGYEHIFLCGVDLGFPGGKYRFADYKREDGKYIKLPNPPIPRETRLIMPGTGDIETDTVGVFYKYSLYVMTGIDGTNLISCSDGILKEIPHMEIEDVIAGEEAPLLDKRRRYLVAQQYLQHRDIFIVLRGPRVIYRRKLTHRQFRKLKKRAVWYAACLNNLKKLPVHPMVDEMMTSDRIKIKILKLTIVIEPAELRMGFDSYASIQNAKSLPKRQRPWFRLRFYLGKLVGAW